MVDETTQPAAAEEQEAQEPLVVAVCLVTGTQGREIVHRFRKLNEQHAAKLAADSFTNNQPLVRIRGLTRDKTSDKAKELLLKQQAESTNELEEEKKEHENEYENDDILTLVDVDYTSSKSIRKALTGAKALYLNCTITMNQNKLYEKIIDCAIRAGIKHIVYSSIVEPLEDHGVPHWEVARHTEGYLAIRQDEESRNPKTCFTYNLIRYAYINENHLLTHQHHQNPTSDGNLAYPFHPSIRVHTGSARDGARVACKMFLQQQQPSKLPNGGSINIVTDYRNPHEMATYITLATDGKPKPVQAYKKHYVIPAVTQSLLPTALTEYTASSTILPHISSYETRSIAAMGDYIETKWTKDYVKEKKSSKKYPTIQEFLKEEIEQQGEPLETVEAFINRTFGSGSVL